MRNQSQVLIEKSRLELPNLVLCKTWKPVRNVIAREPNGTISLPQKLDYHDIGVVSRHQCKLRFVAYGNSIAWREPDFADIKPTMIGNQIRPA